MNRLTLDVVRYSGSEKDEILAVAFQFDSPGGLSDAEIARALRDISQRARSTEHGVLVAAEDVSGCGWEDIKLDGRARGIAVSLFRPAVPDTSEHRNDDWRYARVQDAEAVIRGAQAVEDLIVGELRELARLKQRIRLIDVSAPVEAGAE